MNKHSPLKSSRRSFIASVGLFLAVRTALSDDGQEAEFSNLANGKFTSAAFSPDGKYLVATSGKYVQIWLLETGERVRSFEGHLEQVHTAVFSPDGKQLLTGAGAQMAMTTPKDQSARLWDVGGALELRCFRPGGLVYGAQFSPNAAQILTVSRGNGNYASLWDAENGLLRFRFTVIDRFGHRDRFLPLFAAASFSTDGRRILGKTVRGKFTVDVWDVKTGFEVCHVEGHEKDIRTAVFNSAGDLILTASEDGTARTWSSATGQAVQVFKGHEATVTSAMFQKDGKRIVTASDDSTVRIWDARSGMELKRFEHPEPVNYAVVSADGSRILAKWGERGLRNERPYFATLWNADSGKEIKQFMFRSGSSIAIFSPDDRQVLMTLENTTLLDASSGETLREY